MNEPLNAEPAEELLDPIEEPPELDPDDPDGDAVDPDTTDTTGEAPGRSTMQADILNDDLTSGLAAADAAAPTSDPNPVAENADFPGRPLTDAEIDALPPDEDDEDPV